MEILKVIFLLPLVLLIFNLIIVVHELGHFLAARWRGLYVDRFAVWFGKPLWKKKVNGVTYILGRFPAGGYVSVPQLAPMEMLEGRVDIDPEILRNMPAAKPLDKIIVAVAGPLFSLGLAFLFACIVWAVGTPTHKANTDRIIGYVEPGKPADKAGILPGDIVEVVDGHKIKTLFSGDHDSLFWNIIDSKDKSVDITVSRQGVLKKVTVTPETEKTAFYQRNKYKEIGVEPAEEPFVGTVMEDSPAALAGMKPGDKFVTVDGKLLYHPSFLTEYIKANKGKELTIEALRPDKPGEKNSPTTPITFKVTPVVPEVSPKDTQPMLGISWGQPALDGYDHVAPWTQVVNSAKMVYNTIKALSNKNSGVTVKQLSGPVGIVDNYYKMLLLEQGWRWVLYFSVVLNVNLAIMNMLPFPVLDGGHITMSLLEMIRRKPINVRVLEVLQTGFAVVLFSFIIFVSFFDVQDVVPAGAGGESEEIRFAAPKKAAAPANAVPATP